MSNDAGTRGTHADQVTGQSNQSETMRGPDPVHGDRYRLRPDVEYRQAGYDLMFTRLLQGAAGLGIAGVLGRYSITALPASEGWEIRAAGLVLLVAALIMAVLSSPLFLSAFAAFIGQKRFHRDPAHGKFDCWGILFAIFSIVMFVSLVIAFTHELAEKQKSDAAANRTPQTTSAAEK